MIRALARLALAALHGLHGLLIVLVGFRWMSVAARRARIRWWSAAMFRRLGMRLVVQGDYRPGAKLLVANHVSWLDILAVHAACPEARFISKADVRRWPLVRHLVDAADTLYIERERRRDAMRVVHQAAEALGQGDTVAVFPEGTTGPGPRMLPMHANLLQAAIATATPLQPVVLRYADANEPFSEAATYLGDTTLAQTLWKLARGRGLVAHVTVLPAIATAHADRRALAAHVADLMDEELARAGSGPAPTPGA